MHDKSSKKLTCRAACKMRCCLLRVKVTVSISGHIWSYVLWENVSILIFAAPFCRQYSFRHVTFLFFTVILVF